MRFADIIGKEDIKKVLTGRVASGKMPHAQLFSGVEGSGSLPLAMATIQMLLCQNPTENDSCAVCSACIKTGKLIHPDVHFSFPVIPKKSGDKPVSNDHIEQWRKSFVANPHLSYNDWMEDINAENKQGNITKEECRSIIQKLSLKAFESSKKVLLMWLPEHLGKEGNALLKLIEEPPAETYFMLVSENIDQILPTILSRTQLQKVLPYTNAEIMDYLHHNKLTNDLETVAFLAEGNLNAAQKIAAEADNEMTTGFKDWMRLCYRRDVPGLMTWSDQLGAKGRENIKTFLTYGLKLIREVLAFKTIENYHVRLAEDEKQFVVNFSGVVQFANIEVLYEGLNECIYHIERNANPKLTLFQLSLQVRDSFLSTAKAH
ncbi:MAG: hypothetical protein R3A43_00300 [Bacteroidia bacterium]